MRVSVPIAAAVPLAAALLTLGTAEAAFGQFPGAYRSPFPPPAWGMGPAGGAPWGPGFGPGPIGPGPLLPGPVGPPGWGPPGLRPRGRRPAPGAPSYVPPSQAHIARPDPFGPPVQIEPRAKEVTVDGITARRYDYSFDVTPLPGTQYDPAAGFAGGAGAW